MLDPLPTMAFSKQLNNKNLKIIKTKKYNLKVKETLMLVKKWILTLRLIYNIKMCNIAAKIWVIFNQLLKQLNTFKNIFHSFSTIYKVFSFVKLGLLRLNIYFLTKNKIFKLDTKNCLK